MNGREESGDKLEKKYQKSGSGEWKGGKTVETK